MGSVWEDAKTDKTRQWIRAHRSELLAELNRPKRPPHDVLIRVAHVLGCSGDALLERGLLEPCDLEEQAGTDPVLIAEGIRQDPRWCDTKPPEPPQSPPVPSEGYGAPEAHKTHWSAALASAEWLQARDGFHNHLAACPQCWAPIKRYCSEGQALYQHYQSRPRERQTGRTTPKGCFIGSQ